MNALSDNSIVSAAFFADMEVYLVRAVCLTRFLFYDHKQTLKIFLKKRMLDRKRNL